MTKVNLHNAFSAVHEALSDLFDKLGVPRAFTVPYVDSGTGMADQVKAVSAAAQEHGGDLTKFVVSSFHHSGKGGWGSSHGESVGHRVEALQETIVPKDDVQAIKVVASLRSLVNKTASLLGSNDPVITRARSQLQLLAASNMAGMNTFDVATIVTVIASDVVRAAARAHLLVKHRHLQKNPHLIPTGRAAAAGLLPPRHGFPQQSSEEEREEQLAPGAQGAAPANAGAAPQTPQNVIQTLQSKQG
jgi:hypothetical protein